MIVYRDGSREEDALAKWEVLRRLARAGGAAALLVELGELEQAALDALSPDRDRWGGLERHLRRTLLEAGRAYHHQRRHGSATEPLREVLALLDGPPPPELPRRVTVKPPEGFVHYALDPAGYAVAAEQYRARVGAERASRAVTIGLRSIGTSLSAVVAAVLESPRSLTLRPRGATGSRRVLTDPELEARLLEWLRDGGDVLVVDEGPGATGETFASVGDWLRDLGVARERVVLFPSRSWGMELAPAERRAWFEAATKYPPPLHDERPARLAAALGLDELENLSGGQWRGIVPGAADEPASVTRERLKFRARDGNGRPHLLRYVGAGRWGDALMSRAAALADAGLGPRPAHLEDGFLLNPWVEGRPLRREEARGQPGLLPALERYLAGRAPLFATGRAADTAPVLELLAENAREALGGEPPGLRDACRALRDLPEREAVVPDARLRAREWIRSREGEIIKVDTLDHGDGIWAPGPTDAAWDLAGAAVEFELAPAALERLVESCARAVGDDRAVLSSAVAAYRPAYAAACWGDAIMGTWQTSDPTDHARLTAEAGRYRDALAAALGSPA